MGQTSQATVNWNCGVAYVCDALVFSSGFNTYPMPEGINYVLILQCISKLPGLWSNGMLETQTRRQATAQYTRYRTLYKLPHTKQATAHETNYHTLYKLPHTKQATITKQATAHYAS